MVLTGGLFVLLVVALILSAPNEKQIDSKTLLNSTIFQSLHKTILELDSVNNIAVLPQDEYIVIDGIVINLRKRTYGKEPELGFYASYYEEGDKNSYKSLDSLFVSQNIRIDSSEALMIVGKMKSSNISDILIQKNELCYRWKVSAMHGEEGILFSRNGVKMDSLKFDWVEEIEKDFYHFVIDN